MNIDKNTNSVTRVFPRSTVSPQHGNVSRTKGRLDRFSPNSYLLTLIIKLILNLLAQLGHKPRPKPRPDPKPDPIIRPVYGAPLIVQDDPARGSKQS